MLTMFLAKPRAASMVCVAVVDQPTEGGVMRYRIPVWRASGFDVMAEVYALGADGSEFRLSRDRVPMPAAQLLKLWSMLRERKATWGETVTLYPPKAVAPVPAEDKAAPGSPWDEQVPAIPQTPTDQGPCQNPY